MILTMIEARKQRRKKKAIGRELENQGKYSARRS
jgi:hypothetical protein